LADEAGGQIGRMDPDEARLRLHAERDRLTRLRDQERASLDEATGPETLSDSEPNVPADDINATFERERDESVIEGIDGELALIEAALARVDAGTYGRCVVCGKPIGDERLDERPMTPYCIEHQRLAEKEAHAVRYEGADPTI
jgi:RNA polymerase-binding transcription factor DksA